MRVANESGARSKITNATQMVSSLAVVAYRFLTWVSPTRCPYPAGANGLPKQTPPIKFPMLVYSHRGGNLERDESGKRFIENTLPAFRNSAKLGAQLLELDVQLTRDGKAAVFHDRELGRMCGPAFKGKRLLDFASGELPRLLPAEARNDDAVSSLSQTSDHDYARIPLLEDVFAAHPDIPIQIDLKAPSAQLVRVVNQLVVRYGREHSVLWGSFLHTNSNAMYGVNPRVPLFASAPRALLFLAAHLAGRLSEVHIHESAIIIPWRFPLCAFWRPSLLLPDFFQALNSRGVSVVLYGNINDQAAFAACTAAGANAICTDHPSLLLSWLASRPHNGGVNGGVDMDSSKP